MVTTKNIERLPASAVKLTLTVPKAEVDREYAAMMNEYSRSVRIPGFRPGKVPVAVLERKFGEGLAVDAMGRIMEKAVEEALKDVEDKPLAYASPSVEGEPKLVLGEDFTFAVSYDVFPKVAAPDFKGIEIELPAVSVTEADEKRELETLRERNAIVMEKDSKAKAAKGDVATVDYVELDAEGKPVDGSERKDFTFEIGTGYNLYKFDDEVKGMKKGEEKLVKKAFPADYEYKELAGREISLKVTLTTIKEKKLPELDDDFAQDVSEKFKTLDDLKADLKAQLEKRLEAKLRELKEKAIVEGLLSRVEVELPASMVEAELGMRMENMMRQMGIDAVDKLDKLLSFSGKTRADLAAEWRPASEKAIKTRVILESLIEAGKYECSEAELEAEYARMSAESGLSLAEVKAEYEKRGSVDYLRDRVREDKLMAAIEAAGKAKKGKKTSFVDLFADNQ